MILIYKVLEELEKKSEEGENKWGDGEKKMEWKIY